MSTLRTSKNAVNNGQLSLDTITADTRGPDLTARPEEWSFEYDPDAVFPEVPFGLGLTVQLLWLTPDLARQWETRVGKNQRNKKRSHLRSLIEDHTAGRFLLNGEPIIFDWDNWLVNGQHRVEMVISTDKPAFVTVVRGVSPSVYTTYDITSKRTGADALKSADVENANTVSSALVMLERYKRGAIGRGTMVSLSPIAIEALKDKHPGIVASVSAVASSSDFGSRAAIAMCHYVLSDIDARAAGVFFDQLLTGSNLTKNDPILVLRNRIYKASMHRDDTVFFVFKAWNYWRKGRQVAHLKQTEAETLQKPI